MSRISEVEPSMIAPLSLDEFIPEFQTVINLFDRAESLNSLATDSNSLMRRLFDSIDTIAPFDESILFRELNSNELAQLGKISIRAALSAYLAESALKKSTLVNEDLERKIRFDYSKYPVRATAKYRLNDPIDVIQRESYSNRTYIADKVTSAEGIISALNPAERAIVMLPTNSNRKNRFSRSRALRYIVHLVDENNEPLVNLTKVDA